MVIREYLRMTVDCVKTQGVGVAVKKAFGVIRGKLANGPNPVSENDYADYVHYIEELNLKLRMPDSNMEFIQNSGEFYEPRGGDVKLIAWYLPQYYEMEVNNKYHGKGFTEWTSVTRNIPLFTGHIQPHLPYDVGFYNLTMYDSLKRQVDLAKEYGIYGFCIDYYWFSGTRTMEKPLNLLLENKDLDIHYCLNWCTENWTALWDGENKGLIFEQKLEPECDRLFFDDILPYFRDERYIKIEEKPVLMVYKCKLFERERFMAFLSNIRTYAKESGFPDLYIMLTTADFKEDVKSWGADALCEYPTTSIGGNICADIKGYINPNFKSRNTIIDYSRIVSERTYWRAYPSASCYYSVLTNFDNSPRKGYSENCIITVNSNPDEYKHWLKDVIRRTKKEHRADDCYAFILAWNEWAESAHLEPDMYYGYGYLDATKQALKEESCPDTGYIERQVHKKQSLGIDNLQFYIHCIESLGDVIACEPIARYLKKQYPGCKITWISKKSTSAVVKYNPYLDGVIEVDYLGQSIELLEKLKKDEHNVIVDCHQDGRRCVITNKIHRNPINPQINEYTYLDYGSLLANFCLSAGLPPLIDAPQFHFDPQLQKFSEIGGKYVVFHCKSAELCKDWTVDKWNALANKLINEGYSVIEVGLEPQVSFKNEKYYDYTSVNDIQKIGKIIEGAFCFIGVDSAFAHLANCVGTYGILIFGKYKYFDKPMMYTGDYSNGTNATILFAENDQPAADVAVDDVFWTFKVKCEGQTDLSK